MDKFTLILIVLLIGAFGYYVIPNMGQSKASDRVEYWEQSIRAKVGGDALRPDVAKWARDNGVEMVSVGHAQARIRLEQVSGWGIEPFTCSDWNIIAEFSFDPFDYISDWSVKKIGTCDQ